MRPPKKVLTFVQATPWLHRKGVVLVQWHHLIGAEVGPRTEEQFHTEALGTVNWDPAEVYTACCILVVSPVHVCCTVQLGVTS